MSHVERRVNRSIYRAEALDLLLEACRARGGFEAVVVSDDRGLLIGASKTTSIDPVELASVLPSEEHHPRFARLSAQSFTTHGNKLFVAGIGGTGTRPIAEAVQGAQRILG